MAISQLEFAQALQKLQPGLVMSARRLRRCRQEDAEDLVGEAVLIALQHLDDFDEATGSTGLRKWLNAILYRVGQIDCLREAQSPTTTPLRDSAADPSPEAGTEPSINDAFGYLPPIDRQLVSDWLAGYGTEAIGRRRRLHRNSVASRLNRAFRIIRGRHPDPESLEQSLALFAACSRRTVYRKPAAPWQPWRDRHPPVYRFRPCRKNNLRRVE